MEKALEGCRTFARSYIQDIVVYSKSWDEYLVHLDKVLLVLQSAGLTASPTMCEWGGHLVGSGTVAVPSDRVTAMSILQTNYKERTSLISWNHLILPEMYSEDCRVHSTANTHPTFSGTMVW